MRLSPAACITPSVIMEIDSLAKVLKEQGRSILNLSAGEPFEAAAPEAKAAAIKAVEQDFSGYTASSGAPFMKTAAAEYLCAPLENVTVSSGAKPLVNAALRCSAGAGDEIILPVPCYPSFYEMAVLTGAKPVLVQGRGELYKLTPEDLLKAVTPRTACLILNNPNNPTGAVYSREELLSLLNICREKGIWLIADEVYGGLVYTGSDFISIGSLEGFEGCAVVVDCVSKSYCMPGYRLGFAAGPKKMIKAMSAYLGQTLGPPSSLSQKAAAAAMEGGRGFTETLCHAYEERRNYCYARLKSMPNINCPLSQGAFYLFPNIQKALLAGGWDSDLAFCMELLEKTGLALSPGSAFHLPGHLRIAYVLPLEQLAEAMDLLEAFLKNRL